MADSLLKRASRWIRDKSLLAAHETIEIRTDEGVIDAIEAIPMRRRFDSYNVDDALGTDAAFDWGIAEQDLLIAGLKVEPKTGWELRWRLEDGRTAVYVATAQTGTRCFDVMDQLGMLYRIHTLLDRIEAA